MIKGGRIVEVRDAKTKEDVTAFILTQIILEEARKKNVLLPVPFLHLIIQYGESLLVEFFEKYLDQTVRSYIDYRREADLQFAKWLELGTDFTEMAKRTMAFSQSFFDGFSSKQPQDSNHDKKN
jgi:polyhydroxyalkanoate synthesis regulator protein